MTITLTLNNRQVAMLHAIFGEATTQNIVNAVVVSWSEFIRMLSNVSFRSVAFLMREKKKYR